MTDLSPLLAEVRRIAEEVKRADELDVAPGTINDMYADASLDHAANLAAFALAAIPVIEAAERTAEPDSRRLLENDLARLRKALTTLTEALTGGPHG